MQAGGAPPRTQEQAASLAGPTMEVDEDAQAAQDEHALLHDDVDQDVLGEEELEAEEAAQQSQAQAPPQAQATAPAAHQAPSAPAPPPQQQQNQQQQQGNGKQKEKQQQPPQDDEQRDKQQDGQQTPEEPEEQREKKRPPSPRPEPQQSDLEREEAARMLRQFADDDKELNKPEKKAAGLIKDLSAAGEFAYRVGEVSASQKPPRAVVV